LLGILIGDMASPELSKLYLSDFRPPEIDGCCVPIGIEVCDLEQADDMLLCSTTPTGDQMLLTAFYDWESANFVELNTSQTYGSYFGPKPSAIPSLCIAQSALEYTSKL
jgi:hypothetical protein